MSGGWFNDTQHDDMCPNCVTPWKCNGPHLDSFQVVELRTQAFGAIRRAAEFARSWDNYGPCADGIWRTGVTAQSWAARRAIRAAIGSPKA